MIKKIPDNILYDDLLEYLEDCRSRNVPVVLSYFKYLKDKADKQYKHYKPIWDNLWDEEEDEE